MEGLRDKVRAILNKLNIDSAPIPLEKVAELFSIPVVQYPYFPEGVSGTIINEHDLKVIGVNDNHAQVRQRFTIAHELGHYLMAHDDTKFIDDTFDKPNQKEQEANKFAAELLMPYDFLKKDLEKGNIKIKELAQKYLVSEQSMSIRLLETNLINKIK